MTRTTHLARRLVDAPAFEYFIIAVIIFNGALLGLGTSPALDEGYGDLIELASQISLGVIMRSVFSPRPQNLHRRAVCVRMNPRRFRGIKARRRIRI